MQKELLHVPEIAMASTSLMKEKWRSAPARMTDKALNIRGFQVMQRWEEPYMKALADLVARAGGDVIEVGFGMGISAAFIQGCSPRSHTIIEANRDVANSARAFAEKHPNVTVIEGFWQDVTTQLASSSYDGVLFDTYPVDGVNENEDDFYAEAWRVLRPDGVLTFYVSCESDVTPQDEYLRGLGFEIRSSHIAVTPPGKECEYWDGSKQMLVPECRKVVA